jgi:hypothetical protein
LTQSDRPSIDSVLKKWKFKYGEARTSDKGRIYIIMPSGPMLQNLKILIKSLFYCGYSFEELDHHGIAVRVANFCWNEEKIVKMSQTEIRKAKINLANDFSEVLAEYSNVTMVELSEDEKIVPKQKETVKEKELELDPTDRIKMDISDLEEAPLDLEFLKTLGIEE